MKNILECIYYYEKHKLLKKFFTQEIYCKTIVNEKYMSSGKANEAIIQLIQNDKPFCIGRFGASELFCASSFEFKIDSFLDKSVKQLCDWSGFFPCDLKLGNLFNEYLKIAASKVDILAIWNLRYEDYYIKKYMKKDMKLIQLFDLEPWRNPSKPWSSMLAGKKVLVIHPFESTIREQYKKRALLFPNTNILPEFELKTLKAVQTIAGEKDERFSNWFEALHWMEIEASKIDFEVAIIGCGAYGLPLAAMLKDKGKMCIHMGGALQILFGIKGRRWDEVDEYKYVRELYNENWVYPKEEDKVSNSKIVENGCYW